MHIQSHFRIDEADELHAIIRDYPLANIVTATTARLFAMPVPVFLDSTQGEHGALYGHFSRVGSGINAESVDEALAIFMGPSAYISPS
jgi:transcriptional regulator